MARFSCWSHLPLERVNDNAYVIDLPGEYNVSCTFNVADLSPYDFVGDPDLRTNPSQEWEDDMITPPLKALGGPMTRSMSKKMLDDMAVLLGKCRLEEEAMEKLGGRNKARMVVMLGAGAESEKASGPLDWEPETKRPAQQGRTTAGIGRFGADRSEWASHMERPALLKSGATGLGSGNRADRSVVTSGWSGPLERIRQEAACEAETSSGPLGSRVEPERPAPTWTEA